MIELKNINKTFKIVKRNSGVGQAFKALFKREYKEIEALKDISLKINSGEIVGYIGPNGAGKSTSIKIMSGILTADSGECDIMGYTPWKNRRQYVKNIGVVFGQRHQLWWDVPVMDSYELLKEIYNIPEIEYKDNLEMLTEALKLSEFINTPLRQLSLGQRMRCEIAGSLLHSPKLLFLDEPTIGLDAISKLAVRKFIKKINKEKGTTVILTTHDMNDIDALTDRIILIGHGSILYDGSFSKIKGTYGKNKTVTLEFEETDTPLQIEGARLLIWEKTRAVYSVDSSEIPISGLINKLNKELNISDIDVKGQAIEEVIASMYKDFKIQ